MADNFYTSLCGVGVSSTYRGLLHFPKGIDNSLVKQVVYDGVGVPTSLSLGGGSTGATLSGDLEVIGNIECDDVVVNNSLTVGDEIKSSSNVAFNDVTILSTGSDVSVRTTKTIEAASVRIRRSSGNYEFLFGNPDNISNPNLFVIKVDGDSTNNFYIKHNYSASDTDSPFWINKTTGEVNIKNLKTDTIVNNLSSNGKNAYRNVIQPGTVTMFASSAVPDGYLKCDGTIYTISQYSDLYSVIGQQHNTTTINTETQFQVPAISDFREPNIIYVIKW